jgi:hypothetical protein
MATLSDLRAVIAQLVGELLYPGGVPAGSNPPSPVAGVPVCVFQGWPERGAVDADLAAGLVNVSVYAQGGGVNTSRYPVEDVPIALTPPTLSWTVAGTEATLAGTVATPQNVGLLVDGRAYLYGVQAGDTPASIAASLATLVAAVQPASATGPVVSIPGSRSVIGRAGGTARSSRASLTPIRRRPTAARPSPPTCRRMPQTLELRLFQDSQKQKLELLMKLVGF